ncbi:MAG TPA: hypothetical protein VM621_07525 [Luteibacter sp.]|uniref:hypothetical protein n=1 Tax=Luteibacter sp. TaxID=1886636 RepID=UPI002CB9E116|nr:hypothetical protein [Luteibacter sp.]HVI54886.1 hypothetical protein [Luteibacter sp.]
MTQITPPPSDDDLPDEREFAALYARLPKAEPDASLDATVLAAARAMPVSRRPRWPVAFASAAVLVLAVGVAWQVREGQPGPSQQDVNGIAAEAAPTTAKSAPSKGAAMPGVGAAPSRGAAMPDVGAASAAMPSSRAPVRRLTPTASPKLTAPAAAPAPVQAPIPAPAPPVGPPDAAEADASAALSPAPPFERARPGPSGMLRQKVAAPVSADAAVPASLAPDDRVGEIRRLLGRGERAQAIRELEDLRRRYPRYDLPQDLRDLTP